MRRLRPPHAQPAPAPQRHRLHREARRRPRTDRRPSLLPLVELFKDDTDIEHVFVVEDSYEELLAGANPTTGASPTSTRTPPRRCATRAARPGCRRASCTRTARRCCTRSASPRATRCRSASRSATRSCPVVPMFHANAWGYPYIATMIGVEARVSRGRTSTRSRCSTRSSRRASRGPRACRRSGWGSSQLLDANPGKWDLSRMKGMLVGGSAAPRAMIAGFKQRHGLNVVHGWGMTETSPVASTADAPGRARGRRRGDAVRLHRDAGDAAAVRRAARARLRRRARCRGTARRWASSRSAARGSPPATTTRPSRPTAGPTTAGSRRVTSSRCTRAASS